MKDPKNRIGKANLNNTEANDRTKKHKRKRTGHRGRGKSHRSISYISQATLMKDYGLSKAMIEKYFPKPLLVSNPNHPNSSPIRCWTDFDVAKALESPNLQRLLSEKRQRNLKREERKEKERIKVVSYLELFDVERYRIKAEMMERHFILHVGPTNSGKTYEAIQALKRAKRGAYLGPLRLLALEMFDTLNEQGYPCELLTGEEYVETEGAYITSSTIELCDYYEEYDVCVIDEAQMIADPFRGDKWTKAIYLVNAKEIHICLAPAAEKLICSILDGFGAFYEIKYHERLAPLEFSGHFDSVKDALPGDALIVFSRRAVLATAAELEDAGLNASVIYGALPPVSRREEVRKFANHENSVVVATDAIGMGISLPIKRIIFLSTIKFDGSDTRKLNVGEIKQIAGRAGRFGIYDRGEVLTVNSDKLIKDAITENEEPLETLTIPFPEEATQTDYPLLRLMEEWQELREVPGFKRADMTDAIFLLKTLGNKAQGMNKELLYRMITCPVDIKEAALVSYWMQAVQLIKSDVMPRMPEFDTSTLEGCELQYKALDVRHQLMRQIGVEEDSMEEKMALCDKINKLLLENRKYYLRKCRICHCTLPATYQFGICERCFQRRHR